MEIENLTPELQAVLSKLSNRQRTLEPKVYFNRMPVTLFDALKNRGMKISSTGILSGVEHTSVFVEGQLSLDFLARNGMEIKDSTKSAEIPVR